MRRLVPALLVAGAFRIVLAGAAAAQSGGAEGPESGDPVHGRQLFQADGCYECHGFVGQGSIVAGPRLAPDPLPLSALISYIRNPANIMPPYSAKVLSDQDAADIHAFLASIKSPPPVKDLPELSR